MTTRFTSKTKGVWSTVGSGLKQTHSSGQENRIYDMEQLCSTLPPPNIIIISIHKPGSHSPGFSFLSATGGIAVSCHHIHLFFVTL